MKNKLELNASELLIVVKSLGAYKESAQLHHILDAMRETMEGASKLSDSMTEEEIAARRDELTTSVKKHQEVAEQETKVLEGIVAPIRDKILTFVMAEVREKLSTESVEHSPDTLQ